jgi:hypothetical protein
VKSKILVCVLCLASGVWSQSLPVSKAGKSSTLILSPSPRGANHLKILESKKAEIVKGAPYTSTISKEASRLLADGSRVVHRTAMYVARDSDGRTFKAELSEGRSLSAARWKIIDDPVSQAVYLFVTAHTVSDKPIAAQFSNPQGKNEFAMTDDLADEMPEPPGEVKHESLGTQMLEGIWVEGSRKTRRVAAGTIGNERPFDITSEEWYSPDLHIAVLKRQNDPRIGETVLRLTGIKRVEPDSSLFHVPAEDQIKFDQLAAHASHFD